MDWELLSQGAEARIYRGELYQQDCVIKQRFSKKYRHPTLDEQLTNRRTVQECRCLMKCSRAGIDAPTIFFVDPVKNTLYMEHIEGITAKQFFMADHTDEERHQLAAKIGSVIAKLHDIDLCHGDLTTSNMMIRERNGSLALIDFGLGFGNALPEDKAVDLYVLERAFLSTHPNSETIIEAILDCYKQSSKNGSNTIARFERVRLRGRKRLAFG